MKKFIVSAVVVLSMSSVTGCAGKVKAGAERKTTNGIEEERIYIETEVTFGAKLLRNAGNLIASATGFTFDDWNELDPSTFSLEISNSSGSFTLVNENSATVSVFSYGSEVGSKSFSLTKSGNEYKFSSPNNVKSWSQQFIDVGDKVLIEVDTKTSNLTQNQGSLTASWKENSQQLDNISLSIDPCPASDYPTPDKPFCGNL